MKKAITFIAIMAVAFTSAQDYNRLTFEPNLGFFKVQDVTQIKPFNIGADVRYMFNTKLGARAGAKYRNMNKAEIHVRTYSGELMGVMNMGRILNFESFTDRYTILGGVGGNYTYSENPTNMEILHRNNNYHLAAFVENEFKIDRYLFVSLGMNVVTGVNSRPYAFTKSTETTNLIDFNLKFVVVFGNKKEHADWYIEPEPAPTIIDRTKMINNAPVTKVTNVYNTLGSEYVYFKNDSSHIDKDGLANIEKALKAAKTSIKVIGYCSNIGTKEYNLKLANDRVESVVKKIVALGFGGGIEREVVGIDENRGKEIYDMARRIVLEVD